MLLARGDIIGYNNLINRALKDYNRCPVVIVFWLIKLTMQKQDEIWKPVPNTIYYASNQGRIKTIDRISIFYSDQANRNIKRKATGRIRKLHLNKTGNYYEISVANPDRKRRAPDMKKVHRMVAEAFLPNPNCWPQINHIDGNRLNNYIENLEWCTAQQNIDHACITGLMKHSIPQNTIREVKLSSNLTYQEIANKYSISKISVYRIKNGIYRRYRSSV